MTALKPIENRRVVAVAAESYTLNAKCAHPDCDKQTDDPHHAFPRSAIGGASWFVVITFDSYEDAQAILGEKANIHEVPGVGFVSDPIPHTTGLCREHHDEAEEHDAWVKLEGGVWKWLVRETPARGKGPRQRDKAFADITWIELGDLNPQPGASEGKPKRKRFKGEARRKRKVISVRVPDDAEEDGAALLDEAIEIFEGKIQGDREHRPKYFTIMDALNFGITNADETDFSD